MTFEERTELEGLKQDLIDKLEGYRSYYNNSQLQLIVKLIEGTQVDDPDFKQALNDGVAEQIVDLFLECYAADEFITWLANYGFDLFRDYRFANVYRLEDGYTMEEIKEACFYEDEFDGLMCNEEKGVYVASW